jgi:hypothetical protein
LGEIALFLMGKSETLAEKQNSYIKGRMSKANSHSHSTHPPLHQRWKSFTESITHGPLKHYGGQSWTKTDFSMYRPSCPIEAYVRPEKNWFVWAGSLAKHPFNFNFIFLSDGLTAVAESAACFVDLHGR